eukprot:maker-scaffold801_size95070-snap-gene-0.20 protein:Tk01652 transcript:maker-scaffold801_size95070-snap-gene-0.20-mRNA-1 annotation:"hypothetical protein DAPPUDRAFT_323991"
MTMLAKILKRKVSRPVMEAPDPALLNLATTTHVLEQISEVAADPNLAHPSREKTDLRAYPPPHFQHEYQRPDLLKGYSDQELNSLGSHLSRPVATPKTPLASGIGYAESMNAGKSKFNEDQATVHEGKLKGMNGVEIPYLYVGIFDGHGGWGAAIKVSKELHTMLHEGLEDILPYMVNPEKLCDQPTEVDSAHAELSDHSDDEEDESKEIKMTVDELICGSLESSFWAMDRLILKDKAHYRITGGTTAVAALFICGKLYVANAGDSRAGIYLPGRKELLPMSFDHTPLSDRQRIQHIAFQRPELLRHSQTQRKLYNRHILSRKVTQEEMGNTVMYKDFYMSGWSCRIVSPDDVNLVPLISGKHIQTLWLQLSFPRRGKCCRLLGTIGVARTLGDHDLLAKSSLIKCKEFLTPQPEVKVFDLEQANLSSEAFLVLGTDGLWDVLSNEVVQNLVSKKAKESEDEIARHLVTSARGHKMTDMYWEMANGELASGDDITALVVSLAKGKRILQ